MTELADIDRVLAFVRGQKFTLEHFLQSVQFAFIGNDGLRDSYGPLIHTVKTRFKSESSLRDKIERKLAKNIVVTEDNVLSEITDLIGVRVLHLYQSQITDIHNYITRRHEENEWYLYESPKAYTWDPEVKDHLEDIGISTIHRDSLYTSVHYVVCPRAESPICCEVQVRTLFEEVWGELDHSINYPHSSPSISCKEQLKAFAKLVAAGSRLAESIRRTHLSSE